MGNGPEAVSEPFTYFQIRTVTGVLDYQISFTVGELLAGVVVVVAVPVFAGFVGGAVWNLITALSHDVSETVNHFRVVAPRVVLLTAVTAVGAAFSEPNPVEMFLVGVVISGVVYGLFSFYGAPGRFEV